MAGNFCVLGTGTDTANSVRQPAANSSLVGMLPTRGLTSIAGIEPLDWLRDNTGPLARDVTDAAIALGVMQAEDPLDPLTAGSAVRREAADYVPYLKADALKGKRFAVPWFILEGYYSAVRSLAATLVPASDIGMMSTLLGLAQSLGTMIAGPALALTFKRGMELGGFWFGLPYMVAAGLSLNPVLKTECILELG